MEIEAVRGFSALHRGFDAFVPMAVRNLRESHTATARLRAAYDLAAELRPTWLLSAPERSGGAMGTVRIHARGATPFVEIASVGDAVLAAPSQDEVLAIVASTRTQTGRIDDLCPVPQADWRQRRRADALRTIYGYDSAPWVQLDEKSGRIRSDRGLRVAARVGVCLAADVVLAPYAFGVYRRIYERTLDARIDLRSAMTLTSNVFTVEHPALGRALLAARRAPGGSLIPFRPVVDLYAKVLGRHLDDEHEIGRLAQGLGEISLTAIERVELGRETHVGVTRPGLEYLADAQPALFERKQSAEEQFLAGVAPIVADVISGHRDPIEATRAIETLLRGLRATEGLSG